MSKTAKIKYAGLIFVLLTFFVLIDQQGGPIIAADSDKTFQKIKIFGEALSEIQKKYVEDKDSKDLIYGAIKGMVTTLDPHSAFLTPEEFKELEIETTGIFSGIGIEITLKDGILTVVSPIEGSPADKAGLRAGDKILQINDKSSKNMSLTDAVRLIRGTRGTKVNLTILHEGEKETQKYSITREVIPIKSVKSKSLEENYGYIRISTFQDKTTEDFQAALKKLEATKGGLKGLVLDLRNDPGGLLNEAVKIADEFLETGLIVYTQGRIKDQNLKFNAHPNKTPKNYPIVVLVNEGSASASEIVAGALQDQKRAIILGMPTFGKGSVQTIIPLDDGSGLKLTTARYFTPNGRSIQAKGITPDILVKGKPPLKKGETAEKEPRMLREKDLERHMEEDLKTKDPANGKEVILLPESKKSPGEEEAEDPQLASALHLLKSWGVFSQVFKPAAP